MLLTLGTRKSLVGITAWEYALRYLGRSHPDAYVFRRLEQRLRETRSATPTAHMNADSPPSLRIPTNGDVCILCVTSVFVFFCM